MIPVIVPNFGLDSDQKQYSPQRRGGADDACEVAAMHDASSTADAFAPAAVAAPDPGPGPFCFCFLPERSASLFGVTGVRPISN